MSVYFRWLIGLIWIILIQSCGPNYQRRVAEMRHALDQGQTSLALQAMDRALAEDPDVLTPLLLLERATLLQAQGQYLDSARDFERADQAIEVLDLSHNQLQDFAQYMFSDAWGDYQSPPYEKLLINVMGMIDRLALKQLEEARVEARRLGVLVQYFKDHSTKDIDKTLALGAYLAAFVFEHSGQLDEAKVWYAQAGAAPHLPSPDRGDLLVLVASGRAPYRYAKHLPLAQALVISRREQRWRLSPEQRQRLHRLEVSSALKWIHYPALKFVPSQIKALSLQCDDQSRNFKLVLDVQKQAVRYFKSIESKLVVAALTRLLTRTAANALVQGSMSQSKNPSQNAAAFLIGSAIEASMMVADTPDTRSWNTLPQKFWMMRQTLEPGEHFLKVLTPSGHVLWEQSFHIQAGQWTFIFLRTFY